MTSPEGLHARGQALWTALGQAAGTPGGDLALEACRTADRLNELDSIIAGKGVLDLLSFRLSLDLEDEVGDRKVHVKVEFASVFAEARQQQMAFKNLLAALDAAVVPKSGKGGGAVPTGKPAEKKGSPLDELARRRADRQPGT